MALNLPGVPFKLTPQDMGGFDLGNALTSGFKTYQEGVNSKYQPQMLEAKIQGLKAGAQKNLMMGKLLESIMGGEGLSGVDGDVGGNGNLKAAMLKAFTGIDPYLMSPQQSQDLRISGALQQQAKKKNIDTGSNDVVREYLQNKVSMPQEYMGALGSMNLLKDRALAEHGDKNAQERLIQAALSERLVPEYAGAQLLSQGLRGTVPAIEHQTNAIRQGWPKASHIVTNNLPSTLQKEVERRHNEAVKEVNRRRESFLGEGGKRAEKSESSLKSSGKRYNWSDIEHTAKQRGIDENEVIDRLAKKMGIGVDEFMGLVERPQA